MQHHLDLLSFNGERRKTFAQNIVAVQVGKKYDICASWGLYNKTFGTRNLRVFVVSKSVCPWQAFPA
jgi:hypothetical protein